MKSLVTKRSIIVGRHKTSVSLEAAFWQALREIADERRETLSQVVASIDKERPFANLSSAIRLFVLESTATGISEKRLFRSRWELRNRHRPPDEGASARIILLARVGGAGRAELIKAGQLSSVSPLSNSPRAFEL